MNNIFDVLMIVAAMAQYLVGTALIFAGNIPMATLMFTLANSSLLLKGL